MSVFNIDKCPIPKLDPIGDLPLPGEPLPAPGPIDTCTDTPIHFTFPFPGVIPDPVPPGQIPGGNRFLREDFTWIEPIFGGDINIDNSVVNYNNTTINYNNTNVNYYTNVTYTQLPSLPRPNINFGPFVNVTYNTNTTVIYHSQIIYDVDSSIEFNADIDINANLTFPCVIAPTKFIVLPSKILGEYNGVTDAYPGSLGYIPWFNPTAKEGVYVQTGGLGCLFTGNTWCRLTCAEKDEEIDGNWTFKKEVIFIEPPVIKRETDPSPGELNDGQLWIAPGGLLKMAVSSSPIQIYSWQMPKAMSYTDNSGDNGGLRLWLKLEETGGTRNDSSGYGLHFSEENTVGSGPGRVGNAALFIRANNERLNLAAQQWGSTPSPAVPLMISVWVKLNSKPSTDMHVFDRPGYCSLEWAVDSDSFALTIGSDIVKSNDTFAKDRLQIGSWIHIIGWYDPSVSTLNLQINQGPIAVTTGASGFIHSDLQASVGARHDGAEYFDGYIDELMIFEDVPDAAGRRHLYNGSRGTSSPISERMSRTQIPDKLDNIIGAALVHMSEEHL